MQYFPFAKDSSSFRPKESLTHPNPSSYRARKRKYEIAGGEHAPSPSQVSVPEVDEADHLIDDLRAGFLPLIRYLCTQIC